MSTGRPGQQKLDAPYSSAHLAKVSAVFSLGMTRKWPMNGSPGGPGGRGGPRSRPRCPFRNAQTAMRISVAAARGWTSTKIGILIGLSATRTRQTLTQKHVSSSSMRGRRRRRRRRMRRRRDHFQGYIPQPISSASKSHMSVRPTDVALSCDASSEEAGLRPCSHLALYVRRLRSNKTRAGGHQGPIYNPLPPLPQPCWLSGSSFP